MFGRDGHRRVSRVHALCLLIACLALTIPARALAEVRKVTGLEIASEGGDVVIKIASPGGAPLALRSFPLRNPRRLVFDLQEAALVSGLPSSLPAPGLGVTQVRIKQHTADPAVVRLVLDLSEERPEPVWSVREAAERGTTLLVLSPPPPQPLAPPAVVTKEERVEVRLAGAGALPRQSGCLDNPPRVFIDIACATTPATDRQTFDSGPLRQVRIAPHILPDGTPMVRLVAELAKPCRYAEASAGDDLVVVLEEGAAQTMVEDKGPLAGKLIVVDPGHGGADSGAPSAAAKAEDRVLEKDITLDIGLRLARLLGEKGATVVLTRKDDTYLPLPDRADFANRLHADAFISVHCNSCATANTLHGTSVYYDHANSAVFAQCVQDELVEELGRRDNGIRNANFSVIRRAQCPGVLVETAFINHDEEVGLLTDPDFRERAAAAIVRGVARFFSDARARGAAEK
jgi:N-acetylmuramoyl-L-alanine amidase